MTKIERNTQKIFGGNAPADDIAALGSFKTGTPVYTDNVDTLQNDAYEQGYGATLVANEAPFLEEQNSVPYVLSTQLAYLFQEGLAEYDAGTTYYTGSWCKGVDNEGKKRIYESLTDDNTGNPLTDTNNWQEIKFSGSGGTSLPLFTPVIQDHILSYEETQGLALAGTYVYKTGIIGERYGYPEFIDKCSAEKTAGTASQVTLGNSTITMYTNANSHIYYDIADKAVVDAFYNVTGVAPFYGIDTANERVFLPRNDWYYKTNGQPGYIEEGLPNITGHITLVGYKEYPQTWGALSAPEVIKGTWEAGAGSEYFGNMHFDASASNPVYGRNSHVQPPSAGAYLYFVVGDTSTITHVTTTIPSDEIVSQVNQNTTNIATLMAQAKVSEFEAYNGAAGFIRFSNNFIIQWGTAIGGSSAAGVKIPFLRPFSDPNSYALVTSQETKRTGGDNFPNAAVSCVKTRKFETDGFYAATCYCGGTNVTWYNGSFSFIAIGWTA